MRNPGERSFHIFYQVFLYIFSISLFLLHVNKKIFFLSVPRFRQSSLPSQGVFITIVYINQCAKNGEGVPTCEESKFLGKEDKNFPKVK